MADDETRRSETGSSLEAERIRRVYEARDVEATRSKYSVANKGALFMQQQRVREVVALLVRNGVFPLGEARILDVGCGDGEWLVDLESWGATQSKLAGIDLDQKRVARAKQRLREADIRLGEGAGLPWADDSFDLVVQSMMFTSILDDTMRRKVAGEMARVLAPGGAILWYDFFRDNPGNSDVRGVRAEEIRRLFPEFRISLRRVTLAPPISRRLAPISWIAAAALERFRGLNSHYIGLLRREDIPANLL